MKGGTTARVAALPCRALLLALVLALLQTSVSATTFTVCDVATQSTDPEVGLLRAGISMAIAGIKSSYSTVTWNFANCDYNSANLGNQMVSAANANSYYLFTGIYDDNDLQSVVSSQSISTSPYIVLGPYTQSQSVRTWSPNVAFTTVDPIAELTILLNYIISLDQKATTTITKFGIMYLTGGAFDGKESAYVISQTTAMGYRTPITYSQPASSAYNAAAYTQFMAESPSTVIILGARGTHTTTFFTNLATAPGSVSLIGSTFGLQYSLVTAYKGITAAGKIASTNVLFTATIPSPSFTKMSLQTLYQTAATSAGFTDPTTSSQSLLRMQGFTSAWMAALTLMTFGKDSSFNNYRKLYAQTFFSQGKFVVQDYVLGVYGNPCSSNAARTGAICSCNQGGHLVTVNSIVDTTFIVSVLSTEWTGTLSCYSSTTVSTYAPLRGIIQNSADPASTAAYTTAKSVFTTQLTTSPGFPYFMSYPTSTAATAGTDLVAYANNQAVSFITGPLSASVSLTDLAAEDVLVVEPVLVDSTNAPVYEPNIIYLTPTLDQQMYVICKYLSSRFGITAPQTAASPASEQVYASFRAQNATQMTLRLRRSLNTFMLRLYNQYDEPLGGTGDLTANLNAAGPTVVLGLVSGEPAKLATFMTANTNSLIVICFDDLTLLFSEFVTAFSTATAAVQQRLLFVTNLPYFYSLPGTGDGSTLFTFLSSQTQASRTPMMARAYLAQQFMQQLGGSNVPVSGSDLVDSLTKTQVYDVGGLTVGPYRPYCLAAPPGVELSCVADYIARNMTVWPSTRIFSASSANPLTDPSTPPLIYGPLYKPILIEPLLPYCTPSGPKKPKYVAQILFISLFALLILLLLLFLILFCCLYGQRDPRLYENAPLTGEAVTLVFVDVEKSAALCEVAPEAAEEELEHLHYYLRFLVGKHRCYEVGALKDAYHFASRSATAAQKLIADLQKHMQNRAKRNKTAKRITQAYGEIMGSEGTVPLERQGLRVRIGMHTGPADAHFNEYTRSYIYVGDTKMMTAAIERRARAGQALMSANAFAALNAEFDDRQMEAEHNNKKFKEERLGATPMGKLQLGRQFPPQEVYLLQSATSKEMAGSSANSSAGSDSTKSSTSEDNAVYLLCRMCSTAPLEHERQVLEVMYSALPAKDRTKALEVLCAENAIEPPHKKLYSNDEQYDTALLYLLAARIAPQITMPFPGEVGMSDSQNNSTEKSRSSNTVEKPSKKAGPRSGDVVDFSSDDNNSHCHSTAQ